MCYLITCVIWFIVYCFTRIIPCVTWLFVLQGYYLFYKNYSLCYRVITCLTRTTTCVSWLLVLPGHYLFYRDFSLCYFINPLFHYYSMCYLITCVTWLLVLHGGQQLIRQCLANKDHINVLLRETTIIYIKYTKMEIHSENLAFEKNFNSCNSYTFFVFTITVSPDPCSPWTKSFDILFDLLRRTLTVCEKKPRDIHYKILLYIIVFELV